MDYLGSDNMHKDAGSSSAKVQIIKADKRLARRIGYGPLDKKMVISCDQAMRASALSQDFSLIAQEFLNTLEEAIEDSRQDLKNADNISNMRSPVMQLKAQAKTFNYDLVGRLAGIMLSFLESIQVIDSDVIDIVDAHHKTLSNIVSKRMEGSAGQRAALFERELNNAVKRYYDKKQK